MKTTFLHAKISRLTQAVIHKQAKKFKITVLQQKTEPERLHLLLRSKNRRQMQSFLRAVTGLLARKILKIEKGQSLGWRFWDFRPYTRIVDWFPGYSLFKDSLALRSLVVLGLLEGPGQYFSSA